MKGNMWIALGIFWVGVIFSPWLLLLGWGAQLGYHAIRKSGGGQSREFFGALILLMGVVALFSAAGAQRVQDDAVMLGFMGFMLSIPTIALLAASSMVDMAEGQTGLVLAGDSKKLVRKISTKGIQFKRPFEHVLKTPAGSRQHQRTFEVADAEGEVISVRVHYDWNYYPDREQEILTRGGPDGDYELVETSVRRALSKAAVKASGGISANRDAIENEVFESVKAELATNNIELDSVGISKAMPI